MQNFLNDQTVTILIAGSAMLIFAVAYIAMLLNSNRRIFEEQQKKIDEVRKSEMRYKALFDNSLAGMIKFSIYPMIIFEANRTVLEMFGIDDVYDLQKVLSELPGGQLQSLEAALKNAGKVESFEIEFPTPNGIKRRFLVSAKKEENENLIHAVLVLMTSEKMIG
ncbi:MAG: PAS domain-containing protein [Bacteroidota bacterium]